MGCPLKIFEKVITVVSNMEDSTMKANQNGALTVAENKQQRSISGNKVKWSRKLADLQYKLKQLKTKRERRSVLYDE